VTYFRVWAPDAQRMQVRTRIPGLSTFDTPMRQAEDGWWSVEVPQADPGTDYGYLVDDTEEPLPDPRSRWQPNGVHALSRVYDTHAYRWADRAWTGRDIPGAVLYELHIGTFTADGTFDAAIQRLAHLVELGITHVEVLPVNAVNGVWNWGYDGVGWYAVHEPLGGPDGLKRFVDACHQHGLAVVLDVVYNHLGASGNYLPQFGPYLADTDNSWGKVINLDSDGSPAVRRFIIDNALMWLDEFHLDGLRLDAVHALLDSSKPHLLAELATEVDALSAHSARPLSLIAESDLNDPVMITEQSAGGYGLDAQWDDDVHHALHALLTGERQGYYVDFGTLDALAKVVRAAFLHDGTYSTFRGREHGKPVDRAAVPGYRFIAFLQDHDQVGNRAQGDRLSELAPPRMLRVGALLLLALPFTPMLFMGEEWGARTRWQFFTSHPENTLGKVVRDYRFVEFEEHGWNDDVDVPDPQDPGTFQRSKLNWGELDHPDHAALLALYRKLIAVRHRETDLTDPRLDRTAMDRDEQAGWLVLHRGGLRVAINLSGQAQTVPLDAPVTGVVVATEPGFYYGRDGIRLPAQSGAVLRVLPG
jgi:maltooligosyltrehalose trehalohydrolase